MMLKIALIGCGEHSGIAHGPPLAQLAKERPNDIKLVGVCDLNLARAEDFKKEYGFAQAYTDYEKMFDIEKPDATVAVMPVKMTTAFAIKLLERGMPCVIEKPMGDNIDEVRQLAAAAQKTGTKHMVSVNRRFLPHLNKAKQWIADKGELRFFSVTMLRVMRTELDFVWSTGMHVVDGMRHVVGDIREFRFDSTGDPPASHPWYSATFRFGKTGMGCLQVLPTCGAADEVYEMMGEGWRVRVTTQQSGHTTIQCWERNELKFSDATKPGDPPYVYRGEYDEAKEFVDALLAGRSPRPTVMDVLPSAELCWRLLSRKG
jgi:predicted dehydrogenase